MDLPYIEIDLASPENSITIVKDTGRETVADIQNIEKLFGIAKAYLKNLKESSTEIADDVSISFDSAGSTLDFSALIVEFAEKSSWVDPLWQHAEGDVLAELQSNYQADLFLAFQHAIQQAILAVAVQFAGEVIENFQLVVNEETARLANWFGTDLEMLGFELGLVVK